MTRSSGSATSHTSLTPSAHSCGSLPRPNAPIAAPVRCPHVPSARTVARATRSEPGSKFASSSPSRPRPLSPERTPRTTPSSTSSVLAEVSVSRYAPASSAFSASQRDSSATEMTTLPWFLNGGGVGIRSDRDPFGSSSTDSRSTRSKRG